MAPGADGNSFDTFVDLAVLPHDEHLAALPESKVSPQLHVPIERDSIETLFSHRSKAGDVISDNHGLYDAEHLPQQIFPQVQAQAQPYAMSVLEQQFMVAKAMENFVGVVQDMKQKTENFVRERAEKVPSMRNSLPLAQEVKAAGSGAAAA